MSDEQVVAPCLPTIGEIFRTYGPAYLKKYAESMHSDQIKAMVAIMRCRTPDSGSVVYRCQQCEKLHHFGFAHPRAKTTWERLSMLVTVTLNMVYVLTVTAKPLIEKPTLKCPECGGELAGDEPEQGK